MATIYGYIFLGETSKSKTVQRNRLIKDGVPENRILIDKEGNRSVRDTHFLVAARPGDVLVIPYSNTLGSGGRDRAKFLKALAEKDVMVRVAGYEPVLFDTPEKIRDFAVCAVKTARIDSGAAAGRKAKGAPTKHPQPTDEQKLTLHFLWKSPQFTLKHVLQVASDTLGYDVKRWQMQNWFGVNRFKEEKVSCGLCGGTGIAREQTIKHFHQSDDNTCLQCNGTGMFSPDVEKP